jgi:thiol-disulfide isomerase/thioredoxin
MHNRKNLFLFLLVPVLALAACTTAPSTEDKMMDEPTEAIMDREDDMMTEEATAEHDDMMEATETADDMTDDEAGDNMMEDEVMMETPAWFGTALTNVATGESFTVNELKGKVVLVETLAQWCSNCLQQQKQVLQLHQLLGERDDFVSVGLDIDPNEDADSLKEYIAQNGFTWTYAVSPAEVSNEIGQGLGNQFLNPPSTPMFIVDRHGEIHPLPFGIKSADDLSAALEPFLAEDM